MEGKSPERTLILLLLTIRGGEANPDELENDFHEWVDQYGLPTEEKIDKFIRENRMALDFGEVAAKNMLKHKGE